MANSITYSNSKDFGEKLLRKLTRAAARGLNWLSRGYIHPNDITIFVLLMHLPIAVLIGTNHLLWAAGLLIIFSLLDTLDGELARLQEKVSDVGGLLDAVSMRMKELCIYSGLIYLLSTTNQAPYFLLATMVACGAALITPFINTKGEAIIATYGHELSYDRLSRMFGRGLVPYEVRIVAIIIGLILGMHILLWVMVGLAVLTTFTMLERLVSIIRGMR